MKTHWKKTFNPDYIGAYVLEPGEEKTVTITKVVNEMVVGQNGKKEECTVAYLKNDKPFILNRTNCKTITKLYDTPYIEEWAGKSVIIYADKVKAFGEQVEALRIRMRKPEMVKKDYTSAINKLKQCTNLEQLKSVYTSLTKDEQAGTVSIKDELKEKLS